MRIARFWTRDEAEAFTPDGESIRVRARGWADDNFESARIRAREVAQRTAERIAAGMPEKHRYPYGDRPIPEPIVREFKSAAALVTRNTYGALVLNADQLLFADIDGGTPAPASGGTLSGLFSGMFSKSKPVPAEAADPMIEKLQAVTTRNGHKARLYKTAAGYRLMITDKRFQPGSPEAEALLAEYHSDPLYMRLCRMQQSFRARLTPKPWRCDMAAPPGEFPYETAEDLNRYKGWEIKYNAKIAAYATCRFLADLGSGQVEDQFAELIEYHDRETKASQALPLA